MGQAEQNKKMYCDSNNDHIHQFFKVNKYTKTFLRSDHFLKYVYKQTNKQKTILSLILKYNKIV